MGNLAAATATVTALESGSISEKLPEGMVEDVVEMTGGNPRLLEELAPMWLENGTIETSREPWRVDAQRASATRLAMSAEPAIEARISALAPDERDRLEKAGVFGSVLWLSGRERDAAHEHAWRSLDLAETVSSRVLTGIALRVLAEVTAAADGRDDAEPPFWRAVQRVGEIANQLELARACRGFAAFRERGGLAAEAVQPRLRAEQIFGRLRGAASPGPE